MKIDVKLYNDLLELRNRMINDPCFILYEEDGLILDRVLDFLDYLDLKNKKSLYEKKEKGNEIKKRIS